MEGYLGEIRLFAFGKAPVDWHICDGTILPVASNPALYSLLGTAYGGDGKTTFALPDLRGRVPVQLSISPVYVLGATGGVDSVTLTASQLPLHSHLVQIDPHAATQVVPTDNIPAKPAQIRPTDPPAPDLYGSPSTAPNATALDPSVVASAGGSLPHENRQPFLAVNYCICTKGSYPQRT